MLVLPDTLVRELAAYFEGVGQVTTLVIVSGERVPAIGNAPYRANVSVTDLLPASAAPVTADVATGGSLLANTSYKTGVAAGTDIGNGICSAVTTTVTANDASNTHCLDLTIPAVSDATVFDLFLSTDASPKWVARITEAQRAAGVTVTALGTIDPTSPGAGKVRINVAGTGIATGTAPFQSSNAYVVGSAPVINCNGYSLLNVGVRWKRAGALMTVNGTLGLAVFCKMISDPAGNWVRLSSTNANFAQSTGVPDSQHLQFSPVGSHSVVVLIGSLVPAGSAFDLWCDLA